MFNKHYIYLEGNVTEGGKSRMFAIGKLVADADVIQIKYSSKTYIGRAIECIRFLVSFSSNRNQMILTHYGLFQVLFTNKFLSFNLISKAIGLVIAFVAKNNTIYVEVNDLPYEQAIDLELTPNKMYKFDEALFSIDKLRFIFASSEMAVYAKSKYNIEDKNISVLINGAWQDDSGGPKKLKIYPSKMGLVFVYAGTLNHGRQIKKMIRLFIGSKHSLVLIGQSGDWIKKEFEKYPNIKYLGAMTEREAQKIITECDVGLIPYDQQRFYYNVCYPTKASFYIVSGIPFLSTPTKELMKYFNNESVFFAEIDGWGRILEEGCLKYSVMRKKKLIRSFGWKFGWKYLWVSWMFEQAKLNANCNKYLVGQMMASACPENLDMSDENSDCNNGH